MLRRVTTVRLISFVHAGDCVRRWARSDARGPEEGSNTRRRCRCSWSGGPCERREGRQLQVDAAGSGRHRVWNNGDLVQHLMSMLAGSFTASREDVGRLSLVCRLWRDVGGREAVWRPVTMALLPVVAKRGGRVVVGIEQGVRFREYLQSYGRALVERRVSDELLKGVDLHVELWDQMDEVTLCSGVGPADATIGAQGETWLQLGDGARCRNRITVADRDPEQHRYAHYCLLKLASFSVSTVQLSAGRYSLCFCVYCSLGIVCV